MSDPYNVHLHKPERMNHFGQEHLRRGGDPWLDTDGRTPWLTCWYCGSLTCEEFVRQLGDPRVRVEVADMKYGWPHKVYLDIPNPDPSTRALLHAKFYTAHLDGWPGLSEAADLIDSRTGVRFIQEGEHMKWARGGSR